MLHGCTIDDNSLIGIGAVVLNNAKIGKNCIIGSKALITENKEIPDNSLVMGSPGKVVRQVYRTNESINEAKYKHTYKSITDQQKDLKRIFPKKTWSKLHLQIIFYGREYCKARDCYGLSCKICTTCYPNRKKTVITKKA